VRVLEGVAVLGLMRCVPQRTANRFCETASRGGRGDGPHSVHNPTKQSGNHRGRRGHSWRARMAVVARPCVGRAAQAPLQSMA
jgi:hypothetical protein